MFHVIPLLFFSVFFFLSFFFSIMHENYGVDCPQLKILTSKVSVLPGSHYCVRSILCAWLVVDSILHIRWVLKITVNRGESVNLDEMDNKVRHGGGKI